jgi:hypothetical protein
MMGYAVTFLVFYSINILIFNGFVIFGMVPMSNLKAAVTAYAVYSLFKARTSDMVQSHTRILYFWMLFLGYLTICLLTNWMQMFVNPGSWISKTLLRYISSSIADYFLIGIAIVGVAAGRFPSRHSWIRWLGYSGLGLIFTQTVILSMGHLSSKWNVLVWRYSGIFDLPMLFCLLMAVRSLIPVRNYELG